MLRIIANVTQLSLICELLFKIELKILLKESLPGDLPDTKLPYLTLPYRLKRCISEKVLNVDAQNAVWRIWGLHALFTTWTDLTTSLTSSSISSSPTSSSSSAILILTATSWSCSKSLKSQQDKIGTVTSKLCEPR